MRGLKKSLIALGLVMSMMVASVMPAIAAPVADSTEAVEYVGNPLEGDFSTEVDGNTEVKVSRGSSFVVTIPAVITLDGTKGNLNDAEYNVTVKGDIDGNTTVHVIPVTKHNTKNPSVATVEDNFNNASTEIGGMAAKTGTFAMCEKGVKNDITATIYQTDTDWAIATDLLDEAGVQSLSGVHVGTVAVANLSSGDWSQTIGFRINTTTVAP